MSPYGSSKLMTEIMLADTARAHDFRYRGAALFQRRRRRSEGPLRPVDAARHAPHQGRVRDGARQACRHGGVRHRLSDARRHLRARLHPRHRSRARAHGGLAHLRGGGASDIFNCGYSKGFSVLRGDRRGEASLRRRFRGAHCRRAVRAIRRPSWRPPTRSAHSSAGFPKTTISTRSCLRRWPGNAASISSKRRHRIAVALLALFAVRAGAYASKVPKKPRIPGRYRSNLGWRAAFESPLRLRECGGVFDWVFEYLPSIGSMPAAECAGRDGIARRQRG